MKKIISYEESQEETTIIKSEDSVLLNQTICDTQMEELKLLSLLSKGEESYNNNNMIEASEAFKEFYKGVKN